MNGFWSNREMQDLHDALSGIRLLLVSERFPPSSGGLQTAGAELASVFSSMGAEVVVATATQESSSCACYRVHSFDALHFPETVTGYAKEFRPDVVVLNGHSAGSRYPFLLGKTEYPVVFRSHGLAPSILSLRNGPPFFGAGTFVRTLFAIFRNAFSGRELAQEVFLDSRASLFHNLDTLLARLLHPGNCSFIPNSFESVRREGGGFRERYGIPSGVPFFLHVANYSSLKGQVDVVRCLSRHPGIRGTFVFVGSTENETYSEARYLANGDPRIRLLAGIPRADVVDAINDCDAVFLFSRRERQPLVLLEAMSCGKPWMSTDVGVVSKLRGGIVLRHRNERCFVSAIDVLSDSEVRNRLGRESLVQWKVEFSPGVVYDRWVRLLRDAAAGRIGHRY